MLRIPATERPDLERVAKEHNFEFHANGGIPFWDESIYYQFTLKQIEEDLEGPAEELEHLCFELIERAVNDETVFRSLGIEECFWDYIAESWRNGEKNIYGRMDLSYDGEGPAKLLEYNADTPTTLYESSVFQWEWLEQAMEKGLIPDGCDQFNDLHDSIVKAFSLIDFDGSLHFACVGDIEDDKGTVDYLEECAKEAGLSTCFLSMQEIGIDDRGCFTDLDDQVIKTLFKLYPWEWMFEEEFGRRVPASGTRFLEPPWKAVLSNKGLMAFLWEMFPGHPNLLPAYFEGDRRASELAGSFVRKPLLSRQGANVQIIHEGKTQTRSEGPYGDGDHILQAYHPLPEFSGNYPLVGCWLVASQAVGMCIREDQNLVTSRDANFIPHVILD